MTFLEWLRLIYQWVWGVPLMALLFGLGIYLTIALRGLQFRYLGMGLKMAFGRQDVQSKGDINQFQSLMTALAATVGIGNIAGVATALVAGGVGALFWMWVTAFLGMATKYAEAVLAVKFRVTDARGEMCGGPMYFIEKGLGWKRMATLFAFFGAIVALGGGNMLQANSVAEAMKQHYSIEPWITGLIMAVALGATVVGGIKSIGWVAGILVPFMGVSYIGGALWIVFHHLPQVPTALWDIVAAALNPHAAAGGFLGIFTQNAVQVGISRGVMTSEAGLGTASIASAAAKTATPSHQALVSMTGSFLATVVLCTMTALVLQVTGATSFVDSKGALLNGAAMTLAAFQSEFFLGGTLVSWSLVLFGFTTIIGYAYYAEKCIEYLAGERWIVYYRILFTCVVMVGAVVHLEIVWLFSDIANGLMAYPNLIGLIGLSQLVVEEAKSFEASCKKEEVKVT